MRVLAVVSLTLLASGMAPLSAGTPCPAEALFQSQTFSPPPNLVFLAERSSSGDQVTVDVQISGPTTSSDIYAFNFDLLIGAPPTAVQFVSATLGSALSEAGCNDVALQVSQQPDRLVVGVTKIGPCPGNGIAAPGAVIASFEFRLLFENNPASLVLGGVTSALDSNLQLIPSITFDFSPGFLLLTQDLDSDGVPGCLDNCPREFNTDQSDFDGDGAGNPCDNCVLEANSSQTDFDADGEGDTCDLDDGRIDFLYEDPNFVDWQDEQGFDLFNLYRGSLTELAATGVYTQAPGTTPLSTQVCDLAFPFIADSTLPGPGETAFYLVTGVSAAGESDLGTDGTGAPRPNDNPCPTPLPMLEVESVTNPQIDATPLGGGICDVTISDWSASVCNTSLGVSPFSDVTLETVTILYDWLNPAIGTPPRQIGLGNPVVSPGAAANLSFAPISFADFTPQMFGQVADLTLIFEGQTSSGDPVSTSATAQLLVQFCP